MRRYYSICDGHQQWSGYPDRVTVRSVHRREGDRQHRQWEDWINPDWGMGRERKIFSLFSGEVVAIYGQDSLLLF